MKYTVWGLVIFLIIIHQDIWFWDNAYLVFGFIPIGLAYHACISIAAAAVWYMATLYIWPVELESDPATESTEQSGGAA